MAEKAILFDASKCMGCRGCMVACKSWNDRSGETTANWGSYENPKDLSPQTWLKMTFIEVANGDSVRWLFNRRSCMHCTDAACVKVCPTGALYRNPYGAVSVDKGKCSGCGYCVEFCPFDVPRLDPHLFTDKGIVDKCTFCTSPGLDRIAEDLTPACVKACPPKALKFGSRDNLVTMGQERVAALKAKYPNANLYGDKELGGLHVLYVLDDLPQVYGLPESPKVPPAAIAWQDVIQPLGWAALGAVGGGLLLNVMVARARKIREEEGK